MKHPKPAAIRAAMATLAATVSAAGDRSRLEMQETRVLRVGEDCNTVACASGWYALAKLRDRIEWEPAPAPLDTGRVQATCREYTLSRGRPKDKPLIWTDGAEMLAADLGFEGRPGYCAWIELTDWGNEHPELWGNEEGLNMFAYASGLRARLRHPRALPPHDPPFHGALDGGR